MTLPPAVLWPSVLGVVFLVAGLIAVSRDFAKATGWDKLIALGPVFYAAPLAVFAGEHFASPNSLIQLVPRWMPARMFWVYFVGIALIAAAISILANKYVRLSATLLGVMFLIFVLTIHLPGAIATPKDRFIWTIVLRETSFAGGAWALAGGSLLVIGRFCITIPVLFFAVEHFLHPEFAPGVPLRKITPDWVPLHLWLGYAVGAILLAAGVGMLMKNRARIAATWLGGVVALIVTILYVPILAHAVKLAEMLEGVNYVADTLLFAGTILLLANAMPRAGNEPRAQVAK